jgi:hypothetical protein
MAGQVQLSASMWCFVSVVAVLVFPQRYLGVKISGVL